MGAAVAEVTFLSTLPARGATLGRPPPLAGNIISIHAPREGSDVRGGVQLLPE